MLCRKSPSIVFHCLFSKLPSLSQEEARSHLGYLLDAGSSGERCLARVALEIENREGLFSDVLWALDGPAFERLVTLRHALRNR